MGVATSVKIDGDEFVSFSACVLDCVVLRQFGGLVLTRDMLVSGGYLVNYLSHKSTSSY